MLTFSALVLVLSVLTASSERVVRGSCGTCDKEKCAPLPADGCAVGTVLDGCGCCEICGLGAGEACGGRGANAKRCASGMECVKGEDKKSKTGTCVCKANYPVCGSDDVNYATGCDLRLASQAAVKEGKAEITLQNKGKCAQAPQIVTAPGEVWNVTGSQVYLTCEATGVPTPVVTWKKMVPGKGRTELLPGDRDNLAIQTRGGPEKHEVTGWVLISPLSKEEAGVYECHANNIKGEASASGTIHVVDSLEDIPAQKVGKDDEEL